MIQAIKSSRAILVLFILYLCIAIAVIALNAAAKKKDSEDSNSKTKTQEKTKVTNAELNIFQEDELGELRESLIKYVTDVELSGEYLDGSCIKLTDVSPYSRKDYSQGSAYYSNDEFTVWFTDGTHYVSGFNLGDEVTEDDISSGFLTEYYNSCGAE